MTEEQFGVLIGKLDTLISIARDIDEILIELSCDLTCDNEDNSYRLPEVLFSMMEFIEDAD